MVLNVTDERGEELEAHCGLLEEAAGHWRVALMSGKGMRATMNSAAADVGDLQRRIQKFVLVSGIHARNLGACPVVAQRWSSDGHAATCRRSTGSSSQLPFWRRKASCRAMHGARHGPVSSSRDRQRLISVASTRLRS